MKLKYLLIGMIAILCSCSSTLDSTHYSQLFDNESGNIANEPKSEIVGSSNSLSDAYEFKEFSSSFFKLKLKSILDEPISFLSYSNYVVGVFQIEYDYYEQCNGITEEIYIPFFTEYSTKDNKYEKSKCLVDTVKQLLLSYDTFYIYVREVVKRGCDTTYNASNLFNQLPEEANWSTNPHYPNDIHFSGRNVFPVKDNKLAINEVNETIKCQGCELETIDIKDYLKYFYDGMYEDYLVRNIIDLFFSEVNKN